MWHVSSRSGVATLRTAIHLLFTHLHTFNGPFSGTTWLSRYQKARHSEWQWHQLDHMQRYFLCQHPTTQFFTGRLPLLPPNQQHQSTEGTMSVLWRTPTKTGCHGNVRWGIKKLIFRLSRSSPSPEIRKFGKDWYSRFWDNWLFTDI